MDPLHFFDTPIWRHFDGEGGEGGGGDGDGGTGEGGGDASKTYSKAELDGIVRKAVEKSRRDFGDYASLKEKADAFDKLQEQSMSEADQLRRRADTAVRERDSALGRAREMTIRAAIVTEANRQKAVDPEAVAALVDRNDILLDNDGQVSGVAEAVTALLAAKPYLSEPESGRSRARAAGSDMNDQGSRQANTPRVTRTQHRAWLQGADGGLTAERQELVNKAIRAGTYVMDR